MDTKHDLENIRLTSSEIGELWTTYIYASLSKCVLSYFSAKCNDDEIRLLIEKNLDFTKNSLETITNIFNSIEFPIPIGFTDEDVNLNAEKLFSDTFMLQYIRLKTQFEMINHSVSSGMSARSDVREFFNYRIRTTMEISDMAKDILLSKGLFIRSPYIPTPDQVKFVKNHSFLRGFFGDKRPLNTREIGFLHFNIITNNLGKALLLGFKQCVKDKKSQEFILRGKNIAHKHVQIFSELLIKEDLPAPASWDSEVFDSTNSPFSDELMMFHTIALISYGIGAYGFSVAASPRRDIALTYTRLMAEIGQYLDDGAKIMIDNNWLEKVPEAPERKDLLNV